MISNAVFVARWWRYRTQHHQPVEYVQQQCLEYGQRQVLSLMAQDSIVREDR